MLSPRFIECYGEEGVWAGLLGRTERLRAEPMIDRRLGRWCAALSLELGFTWLEEEDKAAALANVQQNNITDWHQEQLVLRTRLVILGRLLYLSENQWCQELVVQSRFDQQTTGTVS